jgi:hypothetical protein
VSSRVRALDAKLHEHSKLGQGLLSNILLEAGATVRRVLVYSAGARGPHDNAPRLRSSYGTTTTNSTADAHDATATAIIK